ncbi:MAG: hypothetical protein L3K24_04435 [Gammaproteobacteria bacterium]|nr:hypothetical protein [Gammaproteobacteria bacterium]
MNPNLRPWNPLKYHYGKEVVHWPYSSFHNYMRSGLLPAGWAGTDMDGFFAKRVNGGWNPPYTMKYDAGIKKGQPQSGLPFFIG